MAISILTPFCGLTRPASPAAPPRPASVSCEVINADGIVDRVPDLTRLCQRDNLLMVTVAGPARYPFGSEELVPEVTALSAQS